MVIGLIAVLAASLIGPPLISWIGDQTWNKANVDANQKMAEAADYDRKQREEAAAQGINPYIGSGTGGTSQTGNVLNSGAQDPFSMMMPMFMMMMMLPMMQSMFKSNKTKDTEENDYSAYD